MVLKAIQSGMKAGEIKKGKTSIPVVTKFMECNANGIDRNSKVLDFGAGFRALQTQKLKEQYPNIKSWDYAEIMTRSLKDNPDLKDVFLYRLDRQNYDVVMASNVINVQETPKELRETLQKMYCTTKPGGIIVMNIPKSPIFYKDGTAHDENGHSVKELKEDILKELNPYFDKANIEEVKTICGEKNSTVMLKLKKTDHKENLCNRPIL